MKSWITTLRNIFQTKEIRTRLFNTFLYVMIFRLGTFIRLPGLSPDRIKVSSSGFLELLDTLLSSSALKSFSIFALGITPYISASIITQITSLTIPYFQRLKKEGPAGRTQLNQFTRYLTLFLAPVQAAPFVLYLINAQANLISRYYFMPISILIITAGTMFCVWLGDRITSKGLGNGTSVLITASIISSLPGALYMEYDASNLLVFVLELVAFLVIITVTITFTQGVRKIPLQYAAQMSAMGGGGSRGVRQYLPIGLNSTGVMPIIMARTLITMPLLGAKLFSQKSITAAKIVSKLSDRFSLSFNIILSVLIFMATFFYSAIFVNAVEMADDLKRSNGFIPGVKSGKPTANYIDRMLSKITLPGSIFLVLIALMPVVSFKVIGTTKEMSQFFGGTNILITIGVILDSINRIKSYLFSTYYGNMLQNMTPHPNKKN